MASPDPLFDEFCLGPLSTDFLPHLRRILTCDEIEPTILRERHYRYAAPLPSSVPLYLRFKFFWGAYYSLNSQCGNRTHKIMQSMYAPLLVSIISMRTPLC